MLYDFCIQKPTSLNPYQLHQLVEGLTKDIKGNKLFADYGDHIKLRCNANIIQGSKGTNLNVPEEGQVLFLELRASCYASKSGKKYFFKRGDWASRHQWLERKGLANGFRVLSQTCTSSFVKIPKPSAEFNIDCTDFTACVRLENRELFLKALANGVGAKGRAFGFGMLVI